MYINVQTYTITKKRDLWQCSRILYFKKKAGLHYCCSAN